MCPLTTLIAEALDILLSVGCNRNVTVASFDPPPGNPRNRCLAGRMPQTPMKILGERQRYMCNAQSWATIAAPCPSRSMKSR